jgi:hypothetical protein
MVEDPGQKTDVGATHPAVATRLGDAFEAMVHDVAKAGFDPIPTQIGYPDWPIVALPGHEAFLEPAPKRGIALPIFSPVPKERPRKSSGHKDFQISSLSNTNQCNILPPGAS